MASTWDHAKKKTSVLRSTSRRARIADANPSAWTSVVNDRPFSQVAEALVTVGHARM